MRTLLRWLLRIFGGLLAALILAPVVAFAAFDILYFQPQRPKIAQLIAAATEEERNPPEAIVRLVRADAHDRVALSTYWVLVNDPTNPTKQQRMSSLAWQTRGPLWWACLWLHLSEREQITLIVSRSNMGRGMRGFSAASHALFNRPLALLSLEEAATLMAIPRCPNCFYTKPTSVQPRRDWLLSKLQTGP